MIPTFFRGRSTQKLSHIGDNLAKNYLGKYVFDQIVAGWVRCVRLERRSRRDLSHRPDRIAKNYKKNFYRDPTEFIGTRNVISWVFLDNFFDGMYLPRTTVLEVVSFVCTVLVQDPAGEKVSSIC